MSSRAEVRVGRRTPVNKYINICLVLFHSGYDEIVVKARGLSIPKAIEIVEKLRKYFMRNLEISSIELGSDYIVTRKGFQRRISTISIFIRRGVEKT